MKLSSWTIIEYQRGAHIGLPNKLARAFIPCVIPMVPEFNASARKELLRPALREIAFIPCDESLVQNAFDVEHVEKVWRVDNGALASIPNPSFQIFLDGLAKREKKPAKLRKGWNMAQMAERDWFDLYAHLYGGREATKKFGRDLKALALEK